MYRRFGHGGALDNSNFKFSGFRSSRCCLARPNPRQSLPFMARVSRLSSTRWLIRPPSQGNPPAVEGEKGSRTRRSGKFVISFVLSSGGASAIIRSVCGLFSLHVCNIHDAMCNHPCINTVNKSSISILRIVAEVVSTLVGNPHSNTFPAPPTK